MAAKSRKATVVSAHAKIWVPTYAGTTGWAGMTVKARDVVSVIPAQAGIQRAAEG